MTGVSVIVPTYNGAAFIKETLDSIAKQTLPPAEIIVVDDSSTDDTLQHVQEAQVGHIGLVNASNRGVCHSRNAGIAAASFPLVALADQDDPWHPEKLERQVAALDRCPKVDLIFTNFTYLRNGVLDKEDKFAQAPPGYWNGASDERAGGTIQLKQPALPRLLKFQPVFPSTMMFRRSMLDRTGPFNEDMGREQAEDLEFLLRCDRHCRMAALEMSLVTIRKHGGNYSANLAKTAMSQMRIYTHLLEHDDSYAPFRAEIMEELKNCKIAAFNDLFAEGDLDRARDVLRQIRREHRNRKLSIKAAILALPRPLDRRVQRLLSRGL